SSTLAGSDPLSELFDGSIDEVLIFNRSLNTTQIKQIYDDGVAGRSPQKIVSAGLRAGDVWQSCVTPNDAIVDGATTCSNNVTISSALACGDTITASKTMISDLSGAGGCFTFGANDIALNCNGYKITYDTSGMGNVSAITAVGKRNVTVQNCFIQDGNATGPSAGITNGGSFGYGINFTGTNFSVIRNNTILTNGSNNNYGILLQTSLYNLITNNSVNTQGSADTNHGMYFTTIASLNNVTHNVIRTNGTGSNNGVETTTSGNVTFFNNTITVRGTTAGSSAIAFGSSSNNMTAERNLLNVISTAGNSQGIIAFVATQTRALRNTIIASGGPEGDVRGIFMFFSNVMVADGNNISINRHQSSGIQFSSSNYLNATNNTIAVNGTQSDHGLFVSSANSLIFADNNVSVT
ncbi:MAG: hypothetical protein AABY01_02665, partial [Nanoarchaeota archaeon]